MRLQKIISPANNCSFAAKQLVHYSISVSDKEDGESKYDEINPKEVLLEVKYLHELLTSAEKVGNDGQKDPPGLAAIRTSNCFNCHGFNTKTMGPTFTQISQRYPQTTSNIALLAKRIREGSKGIWGNESMPTHPEMTDQQIQNIIKWIMQIASDNSVDYYTGTEGSFTLKEMNAKIKNQA